MEMKVQINDARGGLSVRQPHLTPAHVPSFTGQLVMIGAQLTCALLLIVRGLASKQKGGGRTDRDKFSSSEEQKCKVSLGPR